MKRSKAGDDSSPDADTSRAVKEEEEAAAATGVKVEGGTRVGDRQTHSQTDLMDAWLTGSRGWRAGV